MHVEECRMLAVIYSMLLLEFHSRNYITAKSRKIWFDFIPYGLKTRKGGFGRGV